MYLKVYFFKFSSNELAKECVPIKLCRAEQRNVFSVGSDYLVEASMNKRVRVHVHQRSRILVPLHKPPPPALLLPHHEGPRQRYLTPLLRQHHRESRPPPEDKVCRVVAPPLQPNLTELFN